jgi:hypothetical protein
MNQLQSIKEIVHNLSQPVAKRHLATKKMGGKDAYYIHWFDAIKYLDLYASGWSYEIVRIDAIAGKLIMTVRLSIPCAEGVVYREATGQEDEDKDTYGNASSNAESMALRRAAAKCGLGLYLYSDSRMEIQNRGRVPYKSDAPVKQPDSDLRELDKIDDDDEYEQVPQQTNSYQNDTEGFPVNPIARSFSDLVTAKQLGMIHALCRELGIDADEECNEVMKCKTDELSKKAASSFIAYLKDDKPLEEAHQQQSIDYSVQTSPALEGIAKAINIMKEMNVEPIQPLDNEPPDNYLQRLRKQYADLSKAKVEPSTKTADKANTAQKKGKSNGMVTEKQLGQLQAIVKGSDLSETDICETETDNKKSKFADLTEIEAGKIITALS